MPFQLSPGVAVVEKDFTSIIPAVSTSAGATVGTFVWGPVLQPVTISSENDLVRRFGRPFADNAQSWFTAANFLSYTNNLLVTRIDTDNHRNAVAIQSGSVSAINLDNAGSGYTTNPTVTLSAPDEAGGTQATANAYITGGAVTAVTMSAGGSGYSNAAISFSAPNIAGGVAATGATPAGVGSSYIEKAFMMNYGGSGAGGATTTAGGITGVGAMGAPGCGGGGGGGGRRRPGATPAVRVAPRPRRSHRSP